MGLDLSKCRILGNCYTIRHTGDKFQVLSQTKYGYRFETETVDELIAEFDNNDDAVDLLDELLIAQRKKTKGF